MNVEFVGPGVHKKTIRMSCVTGSGAEAGNGSIPSTPGAIRRAMGGIPRDAQVFIGPSSVWKAAFFLIRDELGSGVHLTNPYMNRVIAGSKKKAGKAGAFTLADMGRGGYRWRAASRPPPACGTGTPCATARPWSTPARR